MEAVPLDTGTSQKIRDVERRLKELNEKAQAITKANLPPSKKSAAHSNSTRQDDSSSSSSDSSSSGMFFTNFRTRLTVMQILQILILMNKRKKSQ